MGKTDGANLGCDQPITNGGENVKRVEEGKHSTYLQRGKNTEPLNYGMVPLTSVVGKICVQ